MGGKREPRHKGTEKKKLLVEIPMCLAKTRAPGSFTILIALDRVLRQLSSMGHDPRPIRVLES